MKMLKNLKNKKGFTLIEIVIVIVIIAILAAMLVPSLLKWVDNANQKSFLEAANTIKTSTLSYVTEQYANGTTIDDQGDITDWGAISDLVGKDIAASKTADSDYGVTFTITNGNKLGTMVVVNDKYTATWSETDQKWTVS